MMRFVLVKVGTRPGGRCDMRLDSYRLQIITKTKHIRWWKVFDDLCWIILRWWFWSWFDANRSTFYEDMSEKRFVFHFRSQWPWSVTFTPRICAPIVSLVQRCMYISTKLEVSTTFLFREKWRRGTDGRTDWRTGCKHLMQPQGRAA